MNIIAAVDDRMGILFNKRRLSRDLELVKKVVDITKGRRLFIKKFSASLFENCPLRLIETDSGLKMADEGEFVFTEESGLEQYKDKIEKIYLFYWNRQYPADTYFDLDLTDKRVVFSEDFPGTSHDKITLRVYE